MTPIRPSNLPIQPAQAQGPDSARAAAQKAFFDAAMGRATVPAPVSAPAQTTPTVFAQRVETRPDPTAEPPSRVLRPGSLLDIRI